MTHLSDAVQILRVCRRLVRLFIYQEMRSLPRFPPLRFLREWWRFVALDRARGSPARFSDLYPVVVDYDASAGELEYYFYQDLWAARKIHAVRPERHLDVGSRVDGFVAQLLAFMPVEYVDIRPLNRPVKGLTIIVADATRLDGIPDGAISSLSSLSVAEHFGLGRYSDPLDPVACFTFMDSLCRVLAPGGRLYFSVPIGRERIEFNAHRVFALSTILDRFRALNLESFSYVDAKGTLHEDVDPAGLPPGTESFAALFEFSKAAR